MPSIQNNLKAGGNKRVFNCKNVSTYTESRTLKNPSNIKPLRKKLFKPADAVGHCCVHTFLTQSSIFFKSVPVINNFGQNIENRRPLLCFAMLPCILTISYKKVLISLLSLPPQPACLPARRTTCWGASCCHCYSLPLRPLWWTS